MTPQEKLELLKTVGEEILTEEELLSLFAEKARPVAYDGFEPSGLAPIHFALLRAQNIKKLQQCGIKVKLLLADFHAMLNNKYGGDLEKIRQVGRYFVKVWQGAGVDTEQIEVVWASELASESAYWELFLRVGRHLTLNRALKSITIMGRSRKDKLSVGQLFYPVMQVTDIFTLGVDICQLGMDQRRANVIAREIAPRLGYKKPIAIHHHMLLGLSGVKEGDDIEETLIASKMSKSDPASAIFVHDSAKEIAEKIEKAFCPPKQAEGNPILEYCQYLVFGKGEELEVSRPSKYGGDKRYATYKELVDDFVQGRLHPADLKPAVAEALDRQIRPIRDFFEKDARAKKLYSEVKGYQVVR